MPKSNDEKPLTRVGPPRRPAWQDKFLALVDKAKAEVEAEEKASRSKDDPA